MWSDSEWRSAAVTCPFGQYIAQRFKGLSHLGECIFQVACPRKGLLNVLLVGCMLVACSVLFELLYGAATEFFIRRATPPWRVDVGWSSVGLLYGCECMVQPAF